MIKMRDPILGDKLGKKSLVMIPCLLILCVVYGGWGGGVTFTTLLANSANIVEIFLIFPRKQDLSFYTNCLH